MVLPGIQALFGVQLVAVCKTRFAEVLNASEQRLHYLAIALVTTVGRAILRAGAGAARGDHRRGVFGRALIRAASPVPPPLRPRRP